MSDKLINRIKGFELLIEKLENKLLDLESQKKAKWKTSGKLFGTTIRIHKSQKLAEFFSKIIIEKEAFDKAQSILCLNDDLEKSEFKYEGYSFEDWEHDFKLAVINQRYNSYRDKIQSLKLMTEAYTPEELKREKAFDKMDSEIADLEKLLK